MWETVWHIIEHTLIDSLKMLPFLFVAYLLIEMLEHKASDKLQHALSRSGNFGIVVGALLGCVPQCGFSVAAANFYSGRIITLGTMMSVFLATSDEAVPMLLSAPGKAGMIFQLILIKIVIAVVAGFGIDLVLKMRHSKDGRPEIHDHNVLCEHCDCEKDGVLKSAVKHTLSIFLFILLITLILNALMELIGESLLSKILLTDSVFQPLVAGAIGLIPNCAASVMLVQLYISGSLSFGSVVAGLCTGAGLSLAVLFRTHKGWKKNLGILLLLYAIGSAAGMLVSLFFH